MDDLIRRADAASAIDKALEKTFVEHQGIGEKILKDVPSAEPERESIKWIPHKSIFGGLGERVYTCNKCGYNIGFHVENSCPNCGARTEGDPDDKQ